MAPMPNVALDGVGSLQEQVRRVIDRDISSGALAPGARLPTEREYVDRLGVSLITVRSALASLVQAGRIERSSGRGTFVSMPRVPYEIKLMSSATQSLRAAGVPFEMDVARIETAAPPETVRAALNLRRDAKAVHLVRVVSISERPAIVLDSWLRRGPAAYITDAKAQLGDGSSLYALLAGHGIVISHARGRVDFVHADDEDATRLRVAFGAPLFCYSSTAVDADGVAVEQARALYDAERFALTISPGIAG